MKSPRTHIKKMSASRAVEARLYAKRKKLFLESNERCFSCKRYVYTKVRDLHHLRGRVGKLYLDERFWVMVCRCCHDAIHSNPKWAVEEGLLGGPGEWGVCPPQDSPTEYDPRDTFCSRCGAVWSTTCKDLYLCDKCYNETTKPKQIRR